MNRILCTSQEEKLQWIEASEHIKSVVNAKKSSPVIEFLINLYKNPGSIEVVEKMVVKPIEVKKTRRVSS